jgi:hypothetical protein
MIFGTSSMAAIQSGFNAGQVSPSGRKATLALRSAATPWAFTGSIATADLTSASLIGEAASIRESCVCWHEGNQKYYMVADVVLLSNPKHPNSFESELYLFSSTNGLDWTLVSATPCVEKGSGTDGVGMSDFGAGSPTGCCVVDDVIYVAYSSRDDYDAPLATYANRTVSLAFSTSDPEALPWSKVGPIADDCDQPDDCGIVYLDGRYHVYFRARTFASYIPGASISDQYADLWEVRHISSTDPTNPASWSEETVVDTINSGGGTKAGEITSVFVLGGQIHIWNMIRPGVSGYDRNLSWKTHDGSASPLIAFNPTRQYHDILPFAVYLGGHPTPVILDDQIKAISYTALTSSPRYGRKGQMAAGII